MSLRRGLNKSAMRGLDVATQIRRCLADPPVREQAEFNFYFEASSYAPLSIALRTAAHGEALREAAQRPEARVASIDHYLGSL